WPRIGAPARPGPSRHQTREHPARGRTRRHRRLRHRARRRRVSGRSTHRDGHRGRDSRLHEPRADGGAGSGGRPVGYLRPRVRPVRAARRRAAVQRTHRAGYVRASAQRPADARVAAASGGPRGGGPRGAARPEPSPRAAGRPRRGMRRGPAPRDSAVAGLIPLVSDRLTVTSEPAGARVYVRRFTAEVPRQPLDSVLIGETPIAERRLARGDYRVTVVKPGFVPLEALASSHAERVQRALSRVVSPIVLTARLIRADAAPRGMVFVPGGT